MADKYKVLRSGQPRRYADSEYVVEVYLPIGLTKNQAKTMIKELDIGFDDEIPFSWAAPRLTYLRETRPGVWEFMMKSAYTG